MGSLGASACYVCKVPMCVCIWTLRGGRTSDPRTLALSILGHLGVPSSVLLIGSRRDDGVEMLIKLGVLGVLLARAGAGGMGPGSCVPFPKWTRETG